MKIFRALLLSLGALAAAPADAATLPGQAPRTADTPAVAGVRALIVRCLPSVLGPARPLVAGLEAAPGALARRLLADRPGAVWTDRRTGLALVAPSGVPVCRVVVPAVDPGVLADLVIQVFREQDTPFVRRRFGVALDGGFAAVYVMAGAEAPLVVRISAMRDAAGRFVATLSAERDPAGA